MIPPFHQTVVEMFRSHPSQPVVLLSGDKLPELKQGPLAKVVHSLFLELEWGQDRDCDWIPFDETTLMQLPPLATDTDAGVVEADARLGDGIVCPDPERGTIPESHPGEFTTGEEVAGPRGGSDDTHDDEIPFSRIRRE